MPRTRKTATLCFGLLGFTLSLAAAVVPACAQYMEASPDVVVFCVPTLRHAVIDLGTLWRKETGVPVRVFTSPSWALLEQVAHRARSDLVIAEGDGAAAVASERHIIRSQTLQHLWRNHLVVAATATETTKASSAFSLAALAGKAPIAVVDPWAASAGAESKKVLEALGLWDAVSARSVGVVDTADALYLLAQGKVELALVYATDVAANPSFAIADRLPAASYGPIDYWAAETQNALSPNVGKFADFLRQARAQEQAQRDGLEVLP